MEEGQEECGACPAGVHCAPSGVVDYANGTFYATIGVQACSVPARGARDWQVSFGTSPAP
jgi:hypothetical protein